MRTLTPWLLFFLMPACSNPDAPCPDGFGKDNFGNCLPLEADAPRDEETAAGPSSGDDGAGSGDGGGEDDSGDGNPLDDPDDEPEDEDDDQDRNDEPPHTLRIQNHSSESVCYLYISPCWSSSWGDDILGSDILWSGYQLSVSGIPEDCYDLKATECGHSPGTEDWSHYGANLRAGDESTWKLY